MSETSEDVVLRLKAALDAHAAIDYDAVIQDKEFPELIWSRYGLPATNEIVVMATIGELQVGIAAPSSLMLPAMIDRIFGMDVSDAVLSSQLSEKLWQIGDNRNLIDQLGNRVVVMSVNPRPDRWPDQIVKSIVKCSIADLAFDLVEADPSPMTDEEYVSFLRGGTRTKSVDLPRLWRL